MLSNIVDKHTARTYSCFCHSGGVTLCDKSEGAFLVLRFKEDLVRLRVLLASIEIKEVENVTNK